MFVLLFFLFVLYEFLIKNKKKKKNTTVLPSCFFFFFFLPLIHLFLQLLAQFVYPLLQPLPPLLRGQVAVVFQGRRLVVRAGIAHGHMLKVTHRQYFKAYATVIHQRLLSGSFLTRDDSFPGELTLSRKQRGRSLDQHVAALLNGVVYTSTSVY